MTTIATIAVPVADSWQVTVGSGWIVVMLIGMAFCFVAMFIFMRLMGDGHGWPMCGFRPSQDAARDRPKPRPNDDDLDGTLLARRHRRRRLARP
jgi:hypothetical protein